jgi:hypothetical protein
MAIKNAGEFLFDRGECDEIFRADARMLDSALLRDLKRNGAKDGPILWRLVRVYNSAFMVVKLLEGAIFGTRETTRADPASDPKKDRDLILIESLGKAWERWGKAAKELEEFIGKTAPNSGIALPDLMKPVLKLTDGVLEDALEFESTKQSTISIDT